MSTSSNVGPGRPGGPDGPVVPGAPRLPVRPGKPAGPGSYIPLPNAGSPLKPVGIEQEQLESYFPKYITPLLFLVIVNNSKLITFAAPGRPGKPFFPGGPGKPGIYPGSPLSPKTHVINRLQGN